MRKILTVHSSLIEHTHCIPGKLLVKQKCTEQIMCHVAAAHTSSSGVCAAAMWCRIHLVHFCLLSSFLGMQSMCSVTDKHIIKSEKVQYQNLSIINNTADPIKWLLAEKDSLPEMSFLVRKHSFSQPSSLKSERLFSIGRTLCSPKRNKIYAETSEMSKFLHYNLMKIHFDY